MSEEKGKILDLETVKGLWKYAKPYQVKFYFLIFLTLSMSVLGPLRPYLIHHTIDNQIANGDMLGLNWMIAYLIALLVLQAMLEYSHTYLSGWLGQTIIKDIRVSLFNHLMKWKLKKYDETPIGRLVTRTVSDIETLADVFSEGFANIAGDLLQIIFILAFMFYQDWKLTLISLAMIPFMFLATYIFKEKVKVAFQEVRLAVANLNTFVQEHISGMAVVQIFNAEERELRKFENINKEHRDANIKSVWYYSVYFPVAEVINAAGIGLLVWAGAKGVLMNEVSLGTLIAFIMYINMFFRPIRMIADRFNTLQMGIVSASRVLKLLDEKGDLQKDGIRNDSNIEGNILFENVVFSYGNEVDVLKNISFEVPQGHTVALVGATGAGKSSIINLLSRFYEIKSGAIYIDNVPLHDFKLENLREQIGVVLQDVFLFCDTIFYNITLGNPNISLEKVIQTAKLIGAHDFIEQLPGQYDYKVMERGATLSVGQRQLISFIRAMVYEPKILILDEATSSVDSETEELIQNAIAKMMKNRTSIVIAHRLSTIQNAHQILVLDKGEIIERGNHEDLLAQNGHYAALKNAQ